MSDKPERESLKLSEGYFRALIENASDVITIVDGHGIVRYQSPNYGRIWGRDPSGEVGKDIFKDVHPDDKPLISDRFDYLLKNPGGTVNIQVRAQRGDGSWRFLEVIANNLLDDHVVGGIVVNFRDITERKKMEEALLKSEKDLKEIFDNSIGGIFKTTLDGHLIAGNPSLVKEFGYDSFEEISRKAEDVGQTLYANPEDRQRFLRLAKERNGVRGFEFEGKRKDGGRIWISMNAKPVRDEKGNIQYLVGTTEDITGRRKVEEALRKSEEQYRTLVENAGEAIIVAQDAVLKFANTKASGITGFTNEELTNRPFLELIHPDDRKMVGERYAKRLRGEDIPGVYTFRAIHKSGSEVWVEISAVRIDWQGRPATLNFLTDISERRKAQEELAKRVDELERYQKVTEDREDRILELKKEVSELKKRLGEE